MTFNQSISERHVGKTEKRLREFLTFLSVSDEDEDEQMRLFLLISEQCLPKLVCERIKDLVMKNQELQSKVVQLQSAMTKN